MAPDWTADFFAHELRAQVFASELGLSRQDTAAFDAGLAQWLAEYGKCAVAHQPREQLPGLHETEVDRTLSGSVDGLARSAPGHVYTWARLCKAQDGLWAFAFGWPITGPLLKRHRDAAQPSRVAPELVPILTSYLQDAKDSPNSGLVADVWSMAKAAGVFESSGEGREAVLAWVILLVRRRGFHHSMRDLVGVLRTVQPEDVRLGMMLKEFEPENEQGAMKVAAAAISACREIAEWPSASAEVIEWLVDAKQKAPTKRWNARRQALVQTVGPELLSRLARLIRDHPEWVRHQATGWRDELFWFMWKSASWQLGEIVQPLLR